MRPDIHVTVIVHTPFFTNPAQQVLVQGWLINTDNVGYLLQFIEKQLNLLEKKIALVTGMANQQLEAMRAESDQLVGGLFEEGGSSMGINSSGSMMNVTMVSPEASFINMLRYGMLALALLPEHSCARKLYIPVSRRRSIQFFMSFNQLHLSNYCRPDSNFRRYSRSRGYPRSRFGGSTTPSNDGGL